MTINCSISSKSINPQYFLKEILPKIQKDKNLYKLIKRYSELSSLTYRDVVILYNQVLPKWVWNDWNGVQITAPIDIPKSIPFNVNFSTEWYYFNCNGYLTNKDNKQIRFYMLRVMKRLRVICPFGAEDLPWLFSDAISIYTEDGMEIIEHVCAPAYSGGNISPNNNTKPYFIIKSNPLTIDYITDNNNKDVPIGIGNKNYNAITLDKGVLRTQFIKNEINYEINCTCNKSILLQGEQLNGLDPPVDNIISKVSGASYLYFSWPSWVINNGKLFFKEQYNIETDKKFPFQLWLDHQGGVVKASQSPLLEQFSLWAGARPKVFPGWNWFSLQFFDGTQFTGYSNKPIENDLGDTKQMIKGTWSDKNGNLSWIKGTKTITKWWKSPDSGTNFAVGYTISLPNKGSWTLSSIRNDQRAPQEGLEQYEGGCDIIDNNNNRVGLGNLECIGWPDINARIEYINQSLSTPLEDSEKNTIKNSLKPNMLKLQIVLILVIIVISALIYLLLIFLFRKNNNSLYFWYSIPIAISLALIFTFLLVRLFKYILCQKTWTCSLSRRQGNCLFNC